MRPVQTTVDADAMVARTPSEETTAPVAADTTRQMRSWWAAQWVRALTSWVPPERLARGRAQAREGRVLQVDVQVGRIVGVVQGARARPYRVRVEVRTFSDEEWDRVVSAMASQAMYAAQLLNGEMPHEIEDVFRAAGVSLFPSSQDLTGECTCADWSEVCRHRVALISVVGERVDRDPFLLFALRGRTKEQVLAALRGRRASKAQPPESNSTATAALDRFAAGSPLLADPTGFWRPGPEIESVLVHVRPPEVDAEIVRLLGEPAFVDDAEALAELYTVYRRVTRRAMMLAFDESDVEG